MDNNTDTGVDKEFVSELEKCSESLIEKLKNNQFEDASLLIRPAFKNLDEDEINRIIKKSRT